MASSHCLNAPVCGGIASRLPAPSVAVPRCNVVGGGKPTRRCFAPAPLTAGPLEITRLHSVADAPSSSGAASTKTSQKKTCVVTGSSSGLGLNAAKALSAAGWHVVMACRDWAKAESAAKSVGMPSSTYTVMHLDLASLSSVRHFASEYKASGMPLDALVCNAAVYLPQAKEPTYTADGFELSVGTNHLGHFLLVNELMSELLKASQAGREPRCVMVGSVTGNTNTLAGSIPPRADLGDLSGLARGLKGVHTMINDGEFDGAKAYKDSKVCNMLTMRELNDRFGSEGVVFSSLYPGCIADTPLFRNHNSFFQWSFPILQKNLTKGYVSQSLAGERLASLVKDPGFDVPGAYWSWKQGGDDLYDNFNADDSEGAYVNEPSEEVSDKAKAVRLWDLSMKAVGLE
ncbi:hypothetical protein BSKO_12058 [Bryopsis sp. KO-2023]|nr:hypothetical protein BSKO_12058 [Bryopsis sp. KO-2023]